MSWRTLIATDGTTRREVEWDPEAGTMIVKSEMPVRS